MEKNNIDGRLPAAATGDSLAVATVCGLLAAVGYTAANICLRAAAQEDPYWVSAVKAAPTVLIFAPWMLVRVCRSQALFPPLRPFLLLLAAAAIGQVGGNVVFQWALGVIGIALTVPLCLGTIIVSGAWMGRSMLGEGVTLRNIVSMVLLIAAIAVLSLGAPAAQATLAAEAEARHSSTRENPPTTAQHPPAHAITPLDSRPLLVVAGVAAACLSGLAYSVLGVAIRNAARHGSPSTTMLVTVGLVGVLALGPWSWLRIGLEGMLATDAAVMAMMVGAGLANAAAFFALILSLKAASIVHVNALNATQATMAALAGVLLFAEPLSAALGLGVLLTAGGLMLMKPPS